MTQFLNGGPTHEYTDAEIMALRQAAVEDVRKYSENAIRDLKRRLALAESFIPLTKKYTYELLKAPPSYGGSE